MSLAYDGCVPVFAFNHYNSLELLWEEPVRITTLIARTASHHVSDIDGHKVNPNQVAEGLKFGNAGAVGRHGQS